MIKKNKSLLWEFTKAQNEPSNFLFASIHLLDDELIEIKSKVLTYINQCDSFAAEINFDEEFNHELGKYLLISEEAKHNEEIIDFLKNLQERILKYYQIDITPFLEFKPFLLLNLIGLLVLNYSPDKSLDRDLFVHAKLNNKSIFGLEDFQEHFSLLQQISDFEQYKLLKASCSELKNLKRISSKSIQKYKDQDIHFLYKIGKKMMGKYRRIMLYERNLAMVNSLELNSEHTSVFATCGAAHLDGKYGILALLKKRGYRCRPVKFL